MSSGKSQKPSQPSQPTSVYKVLVTPNVVVVDRHDWNGKAYEKAYTYIIRYSVIRYNPKKELIIIRTSRERFIFAPVRDLATYVT